MDSKSALQTIRSSLLYVTENQDELWWKCPGLIISKSSCKGLLEIFNIVFKHVVDLFQNQLMSVFVL